VAKPEFGTKRVCPVTGRKFYDLNKDPVVSPFTGESYPRSYFEPVVTSRGAKVAAAVVAPVAAAAVATADPDIEENDSVELVALEDADAEASGGDDKVELVEDIEIEDDGEDEDDTFLEDEEDEDDDVSDLIGDGIDDDEEP
jgi:uncharacterized protein (TIGR02300 family)